MKVLKFGAIWCTECLVMRPMWEEIEKTIPNLLTEYFDADNNPEKLKEYKVKDIPTFIFFNKDNQEFLRLKGVQDKDELIKTIQDNLNK